jgi:hypothetical protein
MAEEAAAIPLDAPPVPADRQQEELFRVAVFRNKQIALGERKSAKGYSVQHDKLMGIIKLSLPFLCSFLFPFLFSPNPYSP